jgi:hypothetical protein
VAPQFDRALRDLLRAAGCALVRQGKGSHEIWHSSDHAAKLSGAGRHRKPPHRQRDLAPSWVTEGILILR